MTIAGRLLAGFAVAATLSLGCSDGDTPSPTFPDGSNLVDVLGTTMHFVQAGDGEPILMLHGNPTSSFLWRNVIPHVKGTGRVIAPDLVGFGRSGKPPIEYRFVEHLAYLEEFIETLGLDNITLVLHDWGSGLGFAYAARHPERIRGIAFMEAIIDAYDSFDDVPAGFAPFLAQFRDPVLGRELLIDQNFFIETLLATAVAGGLSEEILDVYREPFLDPASREPIWRWPNEIPIAGEPADVDAEVRAYAEYLRTSPVPKLWLSAVPGVLLGAAQREKVLALPNVEEVPIGTGLHYVQEDEPDAIGRALARWIEELP